LSNIGSPSINDAGRVVFLADIPSNSKAIFTPASVLVQPGDMIGGFTLDRIQGPAVLQNDSGTLLFSAHIQAGLGIAQGGALFTQSGVVLREGDAIEGKTIRLISGYALNARNEVAVSVGFTDGSHAIALGKPHGR